VGADEEDDESKPSSCIGETLAGCCCCSLSEEKAQADSAEQTDADAESATAAEPETTESGRRNGAGCDDEERSEEGDEDGNGSQLTGAEEEDGVEEGTQRPDECRIWCTAPNSFLAANKRTTTPVPTYVMRSRSNTYRRISVPPHHNHNL
jgi:hypothetical protein